MGTHSLASTPEIERLRTTIQAVLDRDRGYQPPILDAGMTGDVRGMAQLDVYVPAEKPLEIIEQHVSKPKKAAVEDTFTRANRRLQTYLKKQTAVKIPSYCQAYITEYAIQNPHVIPPTAEKIWRSRLQDRGLWEFRFLTLRTVSKINGKEMPESYKGIILIPLWTTKRLQESPKWKRTFQYVLYHEIVHCRELRPQSELMRLIHRLGGLKPETWDLISPLSEISAHLKELDFMMARSGYPKNRDAFTRSVHVSMEQHLPRHAAELLMSLSSMKKEERALVTRYFRKLMSQVSSAAKDFLRKQLSERYSFKDSFISQIGL